MVSVISSVIKNNNDIKEYIMYNPREVNFFIFEGNLDDEKNGACFVWFRYLNFSRINYIFL